jgi:hypothetical protein
MREMSTEAEPNSNSKEGKKEMASFTVPKNI